MDSNKYFSQAPIAKQWKRSVFPISYRETSNYTTFNLGDLVPLYKPIQVLPHDSFIFDLGSLIRTISAFSTAIMDDIDFDAYAFFIPMRLVWDGTMQWFGQSDNAGVATENLIPRADIRYFNRFAGSSTQLSESTYQRNLASHLGIPFVSGTTNSNAKCDPVNILPIRSYIECWNWYFRDENLQNAIIISKGGNGDSSNADISTALSSSAGLVTVGGANGFGLQIPLLKACKKHDYFTSMLPYAEKTSNAITLPIQGVAPLSLGPNYSIVSYETSAGSFSSPRLDTIRVGQTTDPSFTAMTSGAFTAASSLNYTSNIYADLQNATATSIQLVREALALHRLLEIDSVGGTRYDEQIFAHFGSRPNALSFKPELLGEAHFKINVDQVLSHAGTDDESLGDVGAYSLTGNNTHLVSKSFAEPGYILILGVARQATHIYSQGLDPLWSMSKRFDHFYPEFSNFGLVPAYKREIMAGPVNTDVFGYKEYGSEHRYFTPMVTGLLNPNITNSLDYYTLADELPSNVALSSTFITEDDSNLKRALLLPNQDQFVARFGLQGKMVRVVPVHSIPKMVG